jgi:hypothetical protein
MKLVAAIAALVLAVGVGVMLDSGVRTVFDQAVERAVERVQARMHDEPAQPRRFYDVDYRR